MNRFEYVRAKSTAEASQALAASKDAVLHAAGIDLLDRMKADLESPSQLVSLRSVPGLNTIDGMKIGAMATLAQVAAAFADGPLAALGRAAGDAATPQIRNVATVGGNLCQRPRCWYYRLGEVSCRKKGGKECPALQGDNRYHAIFDTGTCPVVHPSNLAAPLVALGASIRIEGPKGVRDVAADKFFVKDDMARETVVARDEVVVSVSIPAPAAGTRSAYLEGREKESFDWALVSAVAVLVMDGDTCKDATIVLGSVAPVPRRAVEAGKLLAGKKITPELAQRAAVAAFADAKPLSGNAYKVRMGQAIAKRTILAAAGQWKEDR